MYYLDVNFYRYFIGRDDQSVNETNMIKRIDQQFKVTYIMIDYMTQFNLVSKPLERYMRHYLSIIMYFFRDLCKIWAERAFKDAKRIMEIFI